MSLRWISLCTYIQTVCMYNNMLVYIYIYDVYYISLSVACVIDVTSHFPVVCHDIDEFCDRRREFAMREGGREGGGCNELD